MTWHYRDFTMINGVSFIFKNHSRMYAANKCMYMRVCQHPLSYVCVSCAVLVFSPFLHRADRENVVFPLLLQQPNNLHMFAGEKLLLSPARHAL